MKTKIRKFLLPALLLIILVVIIFIDCRCIRKIVRKNQFAEELLQIAENNSECTFRVSKIIKYSSAEAIDNTVEQNLQDLSIYQYSDIALYIDNMSDEITDKNTVKELYIDNFNIEVNYPYGTPTLYYKNPLEISKFRMIEENEIQDKLEYKIVYTNEENENSDYETPAFFTDCSNPITIGYINKEIISNYQVTTENGLVSFDGRIFNNLNLDLDELSAKISFTVHLKNNLDESYICNMSVDLQLETDEGSVTSGYIIQISDDIGYYRFFREV